MNKIVAFFVGIWNYLDGKKTKISAALVTIVFILQGFNAEVLVDIWHLPGIPYLDNIDKTLEWISAIFGGTGLIHGAAKSMAAKSAANPPAAPIQG